jgi:uncharacterized protein YbbC (DUF1343 family)
MPGVSFQEYRSGRFQGSTLRIEPHAPANLTALGIYMLAEMNRPARPDMFQRTSASKLDIFYKVYGSESIRAQVRQGASVGRIVGAWKPAVQDFRRERSLYLLY